MPFHSPHGEDELLADLAATLSSREQAKDLRFARAQATRDGGCRERRSVEQSPSIGGEAGHTQLVSCSQRLLQNFARLRAVTSLPMRKQVPGEVVLRESDKGKRTGARDP